MYNSKTKEEYIDDFSTFKRNHLYAKPAPHKVIYYLAIIDAITCGFIESNRFNFCPQLESKFLDNWERYIGNQTAYKANVFVPAFYSKTAPFYRLVDNESMPEKTTPCSSVKYFNKQYKFIEIDDDLFSYIKTDKSFSARLRVVLISSLV